MSKKKTPILLATHAVSLPADTSSSDIMARLFSNAEMRCTKCSALMGKCDCWTPCACGWVYAKGTACRNQDCHSNLTGKSGGVG